MEQKLKELFEDADFFKAFESAKNYEELSELLNNNGVEISAEDLEKAKELFDQKGEELSEEDLNDVNGGSAAIVLAIALCMWNLYWYYRNRRR